MSTKIRINVLAEFHEGPWGGGNQFLKALRDEFIRMDCYESDPEKGDVILFNSHHRLKEIVELKRKYSDKIFVHRVDGPISYRGEKGKKIDRTIFTVNSLVADGTVFQSSWSRLESHKQGLKENNYKRVIHNASDPEIFYPVIQERKHLLGKIKLIATSWSTNLGKGFDIYHYIDENLDFNKYEMTFIGRTDERFVNIHMIEPVPSMELARRLREHDIFIFSSMQEACSNSLLEALHSGLPAVARSTSSNPEILGKAGEVFYGENDILEKIDLVANHIDDYRNKIDVLSLVEVGQMYYYFCEEIFYEVQRKDYIPKKQNYFDYMKMKFFCSSFG